MNQQEHVPSIVIRGFMERFQIADEISLERTGRLCYHIPGTFPELGLEFGIFIRKEYQEIIQIIQPNNNPCPSDADRPYYFTWNGKK
jgi:hypothetical protein